MPVKVDLATHLEDDDDEDIVARERAKEKMAMKEMETNAGLPTYAALIDKVIKL